MSKSGRKSPFAKLAGRSAFTVDDEPYQWAIVILAGKISGEWSNFEKETAHGIACGRRARERGQRLPAKQLRSAAEEFRTGRQLLSALAMRRWLKSWDLSAEAWMGFLRRQLLRQTCAARVSELEAHWPVDQESISRALKADVIGSGRLENVARKLAGYAAVHARLREKAVESGNNDSFNDLQDSDYQAIEALLGIGAEHCRESVLLVRRLQHSLAEFRLQVVTRESLRRQIAAHFKEWVAIECVRVFFPNEAAAKEAALCVREDGEMLEDIAARSDAQVRKGRFYLESVEAGIADHLLSASASQLVGPLAHDGIFELTWIQNKIIPSENDAELRDKAEALMLQRAVEREVVERVRWNSPLG
jgi:hypothetical protein